MKWWLGVFALLNGFLLAEFTLSGRNTPRRHPEMVLEKSLYWTAPMGEGAAQARQLLAADRLHLNVWWAFQEVNYGPFPDLHDLELRFRLDPDAYLNLSLHRDARGRQGVRLSRLASQPSVYFESDRQGRFLRSGRLPWVLRDGLNELRLHAGQLSLNGQNVILPLSAGPTALALGGGYWPTHIDHLSINGVHQPFGHRQRLLALALLFTAPLLLLAPWLGRLQLSLTPVLLGLLLFDRGYWSGRYAQDHGLEKLRLAWCDLWEGLDPTPLDDSRSLRLFLQAPPRGLRRSPALESYAWPNFRRQRVSETLSGFRPQGPVILLLGSSQMWGSGAQWPEDRLGARLGPELARLWPGQPFTVVNASRWGSNCAEQEKRYRSYLAPLKPALVMIDLGNNDQHNPQFAEQLETLIQDCLPARVVLVCEANTGELPPPAALQQAHAILRQTARRHRLPCLELDAFLRRRQESGVIWCDHVHLTTYGQELAAQFLATGLPRLDQKSRL